ncbi:hypothetical protein LIT25_07755 [Bacillus sp. F19]|nr:hypothetical protein LIT25_07755 [Bacillus sp. F19]
MAIWEVELLVLWTGKSGGCNKIPKFNPFFSDIEIKNILEGVVVNITAYAPTSDLANNAALVFVGHMLDCLVINLVEPLPLFLSFDGKRKSSSRNSNVKMFVTKYEWSLAF